MTRVFVCGLIGLVIASGISSMMRTTKSDGIYFSSTHHTASSIRRQAKTLHLRDLQNYGNFGVGKPEGTGGVIILDGMGYSVNENGRVLRVRSDMYVPSAAVKFFRADRRVVMKRPLTLAGLHHCLDSLMVRESSAAVKVQGRFARMKYRNFVVKGEVPGFSGRQSFERQSIQGTMIGFYAPHATAGMKGTDYHFHFIDRNRTTGGVVEDCVLKDVYIEIDYAQGSPFTEHDSIQTPVFPLANVLK